MLPNIVLFTWHDAGDWFGCYGHPTVTTPAADRLAAEGARFTRHFSACAICSPSRAALLTGRHCQATGVMGLTNTVFDNRLRADVPHLMARLRALGYHTALLGVQHEAAHEHVPSVQGPAETFLTDPWPSADRQIPVLREWLDARARTSGDRPFFLQLGTFEAHLGRFFQNRPVDPNESYPPVQDTSRGLAAPSYLAGGEADQACVATLQGLLARGDRLLGTLLDGLDACGLTQNTLVIMEVDHGVGLARAKANCYEPGHRVARLLRWPGHIAPGTVIEELSTHVDLVPTLHGLLNVMPAPGPLDGHDWSARLLGQPASVPARAAVFGHMVESARTVRSAHWRLVRHFRPPRWAGIPGDCAALHRAWSHAPSAATPEAPHVELFDCEADPDNLRDLSARPEHRAMRDALDDQLWRFLVEQNDFILYEPVRDAWQAATRADFVNWSARNGHTPYPWPGPSPADAAPAAVRRGAGASPEGG